MECKGTKSHSKSNTDSEQETHMTYIQQTKIYQPGPMHPYQRFVGDCFADGYRTQNLQGISACFVNIKSGHIYRTIYTHFSPLLFSDSIILPILC